MSPEARSPKQGGFTLLEILGLLACLFALYGLGFALGVTNTKTDATSRLARLDSVYKEFINEYTSNGTNCLPRAYAFVGVLRELGYNASMVYGCNETPIVKTSACHAWVRVSMDFFGDRGSMPYLPSNGTIAKWEAGLT